MKMLHSVCTIQLFYKIQCGRLPTLECVWVPPVYCSLLYHDKTAL